MDSSLATPQDRISRVVLRSTLIVQHGLMAGALLYFAEGAQYVFAIPFASLVVWEVIVLVRFILRYRPWFRGPLMRDIDVTAKPSSPYR